MPVVCWLLAMCLGLPLAAEALAQGQVRVDAPESIRIGGRFPVSYGQPLGGGDYVTIVPANAPAETIGQHFRTGGSREGFLVAPGTPGLYEVRYVTEAGRQVAGTAVVEVLDARVAIDAPLTTMAGARVLVGWSDVVAPQDIITIVPADAPPETVGEGVRVRANRSATLEAPTELGPYEVRYVLDAARRPLGTARIDVVEPEVTVFAPQTAPLGARVLVSWDKVINPDDLITVVPADSPPETTSTALEVRGRTSATVVLPREPGPYEVRYLLADSRRPVGRAPIAVGAGEIELVAPREAVAGQTIAISWSDAITPTDVITIVAASEPPDKVGQHFQVRRQNLAALQAPLEPGDYEIRYLPSTTRVATARVPVKVIAASVVLSGDETAEPGARIRVEWDTVVGPNDVLTLVPAGVPDQQVGATIRASMNRSATFVAPQAPGDYEIRYILSPVGRVLARRQISVEAAAPAAEPDAGRAAEVSLTAPDRARAGEPLIVEWEGPSELRDRLTIADPDAPATVWIASVTVGGEGRVEVAAPNSAGDYEIRYINLDSREIIARAPLHVEPSLVD